MENLETEKELARERFEAKHEELTPKLACGCIQVFTDEYVKQHPGGFWIHLSTENNQYSRACYTTQPDGTAQLNPLTEALRLTSGPRQEAYGHPKENFRNIATGWNVILDIGDRYVTAELVSLMMIWLKICRESNKPDFDNLVDMAGYVNTLHMVKEKK